MIIAVWSAKAGVGVSTLTLGLAKALQKEDSVIMDFNLFSPTLAALIGLERTHHGLDRIMIHSDAVTIEKALAENWVKQEGFTILPGVQYPPEHLQHSELLMRIIKETTKEQTVIVDAGSGIVHPLQKELMLRADVIFVVVTPYLMTYHNLWQMWQNDFFVPFEQSKKAGLIVNQFHGSVTSKDIGTLMDLWLAGELPFVKKMTDFLNQGNLDDAFSKAFLKNLKTIGERAIQRMEVTNKMVKQHGSESFINYTEATEWALPKERQNEDKGVWRFET